MTIRVEMLNAGINHGRMRVRQMTVTENRDGTLTLVPAPGQETLVAIAGQRATMRAGETAGQVLLIEELPPETREHLPVDES